MQQLLLVRPNKTHETAQLPAFTPRRVIPNRIPSAQANETFTAAPRTTTASRPAIVTTDRLTCCVRALARDPDSADLVSFRFAFPLYLTASSAGAVIGWGALLGNVWLTLTGLTAAAVVCIAYGLARHDD